MVALVSNGVEPDGEQAGDRFDTGGHEFRMQVLAAVARAARAYLRSSQDGGPAGIVECATGETTLAKIRP